jgi:retron-type reverse transcriptase
MNDILKTQHSFARKAEAQPEHRFGDLYHLICRTDWLESALKHVLSNKGARTAGVDGIDKDALKTVKEQQAFIAELQADLKAGTFQPLPVRRAWIDKADKKEKRGLGIPVIRDRVVQEVLRMLFEPIWESDFLDCSSGFRPDRRTMDCIAMFYSRCKHKTSSSGQLKVIYVNALTVSIMATC